MIKPMDPAELPHGIHSRIVEGVNGLDMHVLEAGGGAQRPLIVLLHGFPEMAYSWRKIIAPLAAAGYHVVAPDQRGYGRTTGWQPRARVLCSHGVLDWVRDVLSLVFRLGHSQAHVVGHDFGSQIAASAALIRPDIIRSVTLMSSPFAGPPEFPTERAAAPPALDVARALRALAVPRKHYQHYFASEDANDDLINAPQGLHNFLRAYYHVKSADWPENKPQSMPAWSADELAKLPTYYVMHADETMPQTVAHHMPSAAAVAACPWLTESDLRVYVSEYQRNGFRGALQFYRCRVDGTYARDLSTFSGRRIDMPASFISGRSDWGPHQKAGDLERMTTQVFSNMQAPRWIEGAGHWVQQERPDDTLRALLGFLKTAG